MNSLRAFAILPVLLVLALVTGSAWLVKPSLFPGSSHRAAASVATTADLVKADTSRAAYAAASVAKIAEANATTPETPAKAFISQESTLALAHLPAPDPQALIDAERRKNAVLSGQVDEARRLYIAADVKADQLARERDDALAAKHAADEHLVAAAASEHAAQVQRLICVAIACLFFAAWVYARIYGITPATLGAVVADIKAGTNPVQALDTNLAPWLHAKVARAAKLAS